MRRFDLSGIIKDITKRGLNATKSKRNKDTTKQVANSIGKMKNTDKAKTSTKAPSTSNSKKGSSILTRLIKRGSNSILNTGDTMADSDRAKAIIKRERAKKLRQLTIQEALKKVKRDIRANERARAQAKKAAEKKRKLEAKAFRIGMNKLKKEILAKERARLKEEAERKKIEEERGTGADPRPIKPEKGGGVDTVDLEEAENIIKLGDLLDKKILEDKLIPSEVYDDTNKLKEVLKEIVSQHPELTDVANKFLIENEKRLEEGAYRDEAQIERLQKEFAENPHRLEDSFGNPYDMSLGLDIKIGIYVEAVYRSFKDWAEENGVSAADFRRALLARLNKEGYKFYKEEQGKKAGSMVRKRQLKSPFDVALMGLGDAMENKGVDIYPMRRSKETEVFVPTGRNDNY